ncbi:protein translocase subunit SecF [Candidatus Pacearchaeota archaeon]|nr:protein translocase subunit SecF [Candidatus Pacearchaeota archaeon]
MEDNKHQQTHKKHWYDRYYKLILLPPILLLVVCLVYLGIFYANHNDLIYKDASLSGGTTITISEKIDSNLIEQIKQKMPDSYVREINDLASGEHIAVIIDTSLPPEEAQPIIEEIIGFKLTSLNSSIEFTGPSLSNNFYKQLIIAIIISFVLMSFVIFFLFRTFIPSIAVIFAAFADIVFALTFVNIFEIKLSAAGIAAFLMLIGYSVDTDILLTTRVLKKSEGSVNERIFGAFKTGIFMTITGLLAVLPAFFVITGLPDSFRQIFLILAVGLSADIVNTWLTNASIIKWYADAKGIK